VLLIVISIVTWIVLHRSVYGRYLFATGRNPEAARYAGINTRWVITIAYVISGALTAISGIIFAFYTNSVSPANHGNAYELSLDRGSSAGWMLFARRRGFSRRNHHRRGAASSATESR